MRLKWILAFIFLTLAGGPVVTAREVIQGGDCYIGPDQVVEGNLFALCQTLEVSGRINGDLFALAVTAELNGTVTGNVYLLAGQMDARGPIGRDLIFVGPTLRVHPTVTFEDTASSLLALTINTDIASGARIPGSVTAAGYQLIVSGRVGRDIRFWGSALTIRGQVGGNVDASVGDEQLSDISQFQTLLLPFRFNIRLIPPGLTVGTQGQIDGQLTYSATSPGQIDGQVAGETIFNRIITVPDFAQIEELGSEDNITWLTTYGILVVREFVVLVAVSVLLAYGFQRPLQMPLLPLRQRPLNSLGTGILAFILFIGLWIVVFILIVLVVLAAAALQLGDLALLGFITLGVINIGGAGAFYFITFFIARAVVCLALGRFLVQLTLGDSGRLLYIPLVIGVALLSLLIYLPVIGLVINALVLALGLGAMSQAVMQMRPAARRAPVLPELRTTTSLVPPPIIEPQPRGPGMDNLPQGFRWWDD